MAKRLLLFSIGFVRFDQSGKITPMVYNRPKAYHQRKSNQKKICLPFITSVSSKPAKYQAPMF
jgi:hypothetical protein